MRLALVIALVVVSGCGKRDSTPAASSGGSSAQGSGAAGSGSGSASSDPWAKSATPAADAAAAEAPCNDDDIQAHIDASLKVSMAYLAAIEAKAKRWGKDCERAKKDLLALEPEATALMESMQEFITWGRALSPSCAKRVEQIGDRRSEARDIEARTPALEAKVTPILERCAKHPGFVEAAAKGLRVMQKKKPAP
jgi:hypothetical protein